MLHGDVPASFASVGQIPISSIPDLQDSNHPPSSIPLELTVPSPTTPSTECDEGQGERGEHPGPAQTGVWEDLIFKAE